MGKKKTGRNAPCPCGSGKKHKKCCLGQARPAATPPAERADGSRPRDGLSYSAAAAKLQYLTAYAAAKLFEKSEELAKMKRLAPAEARLYWTPSRVRALTTEQLLARLQAFGIDASRPRFVALSEEYWSAWELSDSWRAKCSSLSRHDDDFLGLAACELWTRFCPEPPSIEMLDDRMQEGYDQAQQNRHAPACDRWAQVWAVIAARLRPEMRTCADAAKVFEGSQCLFNWIQDYQLALYYAALDDEEYARAGISYAKAVLAQFTAERSIFRLNFRRDLCLHHYLAGRPEEGERLFLELIDEHPDSCAGYVGLADALTYGVPRRGGRRDPARALELLERALAKPVTDAADYGLDLRLDHLRKLVAEASAEPAAGTRPMGA